MARKRNSDDLYPLNMYRKEVAELIGVSENWFKENIASVPSFPKVYVGSEERYPRDPVIEWWSHNWDLFSKSRN